MGKGQIKSGGEDGLYTIDLLYSTGNYEAEIGALDAKIADLQAKLNAFPSTLTPSQEMDKKIVLLTKVAMEKRKQSLEADFEETKTVSAWCADLSEELSGVVGTIEVPGESVNINIKPGYTDGAAYNTGDGQLQPLVTMDYAGVFYNLAMLPGWQKWKPTYRYGTISNIVGDNADVSLEGATSTQQGLNVNQGDSLSGVPIEYMNCDGRAFEDGDEVLVQFLGQDFSNPKIIGFKQEPKECPSKYIVITHGSYTTIFSYWINEQDITEARLKYPDTGDNVVFPVLSSQISFFYDDLVEIGDEEMFFKVYQSAKDTNSFGPISGLLSCPIYTWLLGGTGGEPTTGCYNNGWPCRYGYCQDGPYQTPRPTFDVTGWIDKDGNAITEAIQTSEVESQAWYQAQSSPSRNDLAYKYHIEHSEKLNYYSCEKWQSNMSVGVPRVGLITSKDLFSVMAYERTDSLIYQPDWIEWEHTINPPYGSTLNNGLIYTKYVKEFPMGIPSLEYAKVDCYVANNYQDPLFSETEPTEYFGFKGVYSKDMAIAVLAYRVENERHLETDPVTIIEKDIIPKTLASVNIHWQASEWSTDFDPWNMTDTNALIKSKVQEMFDLVGGYNLETNIEFWEFPEEEE